MWPGEGVSGGPDGLRACRGSSRLGGVVPVTRPMEAIACSTSARLEDGPGDAWRERLGVRFGVRVGVRFGVRVDAAADSAAAGLSAAGAWWIRSLARASRSRSESEKLEECERRLGRSGEQPGENERERSGVLGAVRLKPDPRGDGVLCAQRLRLPSWLTDLLDDEPARGLCGDGPADRETGVVNDRLAALRRLYGFEWVLVTASGKAAAARVGR